MSDPIPDDVIQIEKEDVIDAMKRIEKDKAVSVDEVMDYIYQKEN